MNALQLDRVNAFYGKSHILHSVSLQVKAGTLVALLGRNGAGKTTTIRAILGLIPFYANSFVLGHQWNRVCRLRVSGSWARTRHRAATASIISSWARKYRVATASCTKGHTRATGGCAGL